MQPMRISGKSMDDKGLAVYNWKTPGGWEGQTVFVWVTVTNLKETATSSLILTLVNIQHYE